MVKLYSYYSWTELLCSGVEDELVPSDYCSGGFLAVMIIAHILQILYMGSQWSQPEDNGPLKITDQMY